MSEERISTAGDGGLCSRVPGKLFVLETSIIQDFARGESIIFPCLLLLAVLECNTSGCGVGVGVHTHRNAHT